MARISCHLFVNISDAKHMLGKLALQATSFRKGSPPTGSEVCAWPTKCGQFDLLTEGEFSPSPIGCDSCSLLVGGEAFTWAIGGKYIA